MRTWFTLSVALVVLFTGSSCFHHTTSIQVKKDGTGTIDVHYYFSPQMLAMVDQLGALGAAAGNAPGGGAGAPDIAQLKGLTKPDEASLQKDAAGFGEGVRYVKHEAGKDADGWEGYKVTYAFDDIRQVRIDQNTMPGQAKALVDSAGGEAKRPQTGGISFDLEGDLLTVKSSFAKESLDGLLDKDQIEQAKQMGMSPSQSLKMAGGMVQGMKIGYYLEAEGGIAETNADYVDGKRITLTESDMVRVLNDPNLGSFVDRVIADPSAGTLEASREVVKKIEGLKVDTKEEIRVKLK